MTWAGILSVIRFLPAMIELAGKIQEFISQGLELHNIKEAMKSIDKGFIEKNAADRARRLNDVFRNP